MFHSIMLPKGPIKVCVKYTPLESYLKFICFDAQQQFGLLWYDPWYEMLAAPLEKESCAGKDEKFIMAPMATVGI